MQTSYNGIPVPARMGKAIEYANGKLHGSRPSRSFRSSKAMGRGAISGRHRSGCSMRRWRRLTAASARWSGSRCWPARRLSQDAELAAGRYGEGDGGLSRVDQRAADDAGGWRDSLAECGAAAVDGSVPVRSAGEVLRGRAEPGEASGEAGRRDLPREHGGHLCGDRVPRRDARGGEVHRVCE